MTISTPLFSNLRATPRHWKARALLPALCAVLLASFAPVSHSAQSNAPGPVTLKTGGGGDGAVDFWLETSLKRVFPRTSPGSASLRLLAARNSRISFQVCLKNRRLQELTADCALAGADDLKPQVRYVGLVPMHHLTVGTERSEIEGANFLPGLVPDPLWPLSSVTSIGPDESRSFWVTLHVPASAEPGRREFKVQMSVLGKKFKAELPVELEVSQLVLQPRKDFPVIHWWRGEATWDYYRTGMFDQRWYEITRWQLEDMLAHGSDVVYVPMFFDRRETFKRPCQLLVINEPRPGQYEFDWSRVKQFTDLCKEIGFRKFEWSHLWIYWGVENPVRAYTKKGDEFVMLWPPDISGFSDTFTNFLKQFLPQFHDFLVKENLLADSYFHLSDEPGSGQHVENYRRARQILRDLAPWMKTMDALSDIRYGKEGLTDIPIPIVSSAQAYIDAGIPHWVYYCCAPTGPWLNRFCDTPLAKIRMSGWLFYRLKAQGFLHWGFNYWHKMEQEVIGDPFNDLSNASWPGIPHGDPFMIYPDPDGKPIDSLRWEVFAESLQDYALLQTAGINPEDPLLSDLKSYASFPKNEQWIQSALEKILRRPAEAKPAAK